jgi:zinc protease
MKQRILSLCLLFFSMMGFAQPIDWNKELPADPNVYVGKLPNGITYYLRHNEEPKNRASFYIIRNVGALLEEDNQDGLAHFLEHMAFNGTTGENGYIKLNQGDSFNKIDKLGGWTNASTNYAVTDYVNSTPLLEEKDLEEQIKIIAGMTEDLALTPEMIEKEKGPVCSEINMILDNSQTILIDQSVRTLFNIKSSAYELVAGSTKHIENLTRKKVKTYYDKYYTPDNMNLVITGNVDPEKVIALVSKNFHSKKTRTGNVYEEKISPIKNTIRKFMIDNELCNMNQ